MSLEPAVMPRARTHSLNEVRAAIPEACYVRSARRASWTLAQATLLYAAPVVGLALDDRWWALIGLWLLAGLGVAGLFVIGHDASHGALLSAPRANRLLAQACMLPSCHVEAAWDLGHNRIHHGYTTRQGFDFVWHPLTVHEYRELGALARLRHRLEWSCLGSGAYFARVVWWQKMWRFSAPGKRHRAIVKDKITVTTILVAVFAATVVLGWLGGGWIGALWVPFKVLVVPFLLFLQIIGWTVYVHHVAPEIRWWSRREWTQYNGQMESTTILRTPWLVNRLWLHNIFVHVPHHVDVRIPFHQLPRAAAAIAEAYPRTVRTSRLSVREYVRATGACKLYDFDAGEWLPYSAASAPHAEG
jgi:omega-6 fatty acid desaturase (delta-12 desaturase)